MRGTSTFRAALFVAGISPMLAATACVTGAVENSPGGAGGTGPGGAGGASSSTSASTGGAGGASSSTSASTGGAGGSGGAEGALAQLPLHIDYFPDGGVTFVAKVTVGKKQIEAVVDTGSSGLRILPGVLEDSDLASTSSVTVTETYGGGLVITGPVATANVALAGLTTPRPIPVQMITTVGCTTEMPTCNAQGQDASTFRFGRGKYPAIMGVGMRNPNGAGDVANPIVQLAGHPAYVISASGGYGAPSAELILGPTPAQKAKFATTMLPASMNGKPLADGSPSFNDRQNHLCITDKTQATSYCAPALLDTGGGKAQVYWAPYATTNPMVLSSGDAIDVQIRASADPMSPLLGEYQFTVGSPRKLALDTVVINPSSGSSWINTGPQIFFHYQVLFDQTNGLEGLAPL